MEKLTKTINGFEISIYFMDVSPSLAKELLKDNTHNRKKNERHIKALVENILAGFWMFNGDTICFDCRGVLLDGQHRLEAIAKSGKTTPCLIVAGLDPKSIETKDTEIKPRSLKDVLDIDGIANSTYIAATSNKFFNLRQNYTIVNGRAGSLPTAIPLRKRLEHFYEHKDLYINVLKASTAWSRNGGLIAVTDIAGMMLYLILEKGHAWDTIFLFFSYINDFSVSVPFNCILELRRKLIADLQKNRSLRMLPVIKQAYITKCWNLYIKNKDVKVLSYNPEREGKIQFL